MLKLLSHTEPHTLAIGRAIGGLLRAGDIVAIDGELGAGKTRLVRGIALGMGIDVASVSSPTYVVINEYLRPPAADDPADPLGIAPLAPDDELHSAIGGPAARLFHVDAYRLSGPDDLDSLGWDRVTDPALAAAVAIEWAARIDAGLPQYGAGGGIARVRMEAIGGMGEESDEDDPPSGTRQVTIDAPPTWRSREAWREVARVAAVLGVDRASAPPSRAPLPRGWAICPVTGRAVPPDAPTYPFADKRARMVDLGRWATGAYTISREIRPEDEGDESPHG